MYYPQELIEEIRLQNDIVEVISEKVPLKKKGNSYFGLCPFHSEKTPSFSVSADKQMYYCFGCQAAGNVYSFVMHTENCDFPEAIEKLAERANIPLPKPEFSGEYIEEERLKNRIYEIHAEAGRFYHKELLSKAGEDALKYLKNRGLSDGMLRKFGLGYASSGKNILYTHLKELGYSDSELLKSGLVKEKDKAILDRFYNRVMFPIFDIKGRAIGFGGRILGPGEPKYLNSPETLVFNKKRVLYGLNFAKATKMRELIIVEGYMDATSVYQAGFHNVAASMGTAFNSEQIAILKKVANEIILLFDSDSAGEAASLRAIPTLVSGGLKVRVARVYGEKDPDAFIKKYGRLEFRKILINAQSHVSFKIETLKKQYNLNNPEHKIMFLTDVAKELSELESAIERDVYAKEISKDTGIDKEALELEINKLKDAEEYKFQKEAKESRFNKYKAEFEDGGGKGVIAAQRDLLGLCAVDAKALKEVKKHISPGEFADDAYKGLAEIIFFAEEGERLFPADIISRFYDVKEQEKVSAAFAREPYYSSLKEKEKAITEEIRIIKRWNLDIEISLAKSADEIKELLEKRKQIDEFTLVISDET